MANKNALAIPGVKADMELTKDDLIAVAVNKRETDLRNQQSKLEKEIRDLDKQIDGQTREFEKSFNACAKTGSSTKKIEDALKNVGIKVVTEISYVNHNYMTCSVEISSAASKKRKWEVDICGTIKVVLDTKTKKLQEQLKKNVEFISGLRDQAIEIRKNLAELGTVERAAKAGLARKVLEGSKEGRELLTSIDLKNLCLPSPQK